MDKFYFDTLLDTKIYDQTYQTRTIQFLYAFLYIYICRYTAKQGLLLPFKVSKMKLEFGRKLAECRKAKKLSQRDLAKLLNTSYSVIGKYEREEMTPSIEAAVKLAGLLGTTVGYLLGENKESLLFKDPAMLKRLEEIEGLPDEDKSGVLYALDNLLRAAKFKTL